MKVAIIGGAGYIGAHVVNLIQQNNLKVFVFDNLSSGKIDNINCEVHIGDITDYKSMDNFIKKANPDIIIHLAAKKSAPESMNDPMKYFTNNVLGTTNLVRCCINRRIKKIIFSSSAAVYGTPNNNPISESAPLIPNNYYGLTKVLCEQTINYFKNTIGASVIILRYFNVAGYGKFIKFPENNNYNLFPVLFNVISGKKTHFSVFGSDFNTPDGSCIRDYVHVLDIAKAHVQAIKYNGNHTIFNLGSGKGFSVNEILDRVSKLIGSFPVKFEDRRTGDPPALVCDYSLAFKELGWKPSYSLDDMIISTAKLYGLKINSP